MASKLQAELALPTAVTLVPAFKASLMAPAVAAAAAAAELAAALAETVEPGTMALAGQAPD